jgi:glycosyltransferase involved in cell wall biosynthesis/predicted metal-dependent phosphoesterase TrpH
VTATRCDLHVHSRYSTDSGNYALRRARLGESYTDPERLYRVCRQRGMDFVTISDHNTVEGALRIAHLPDTFLSVEVTTRFEEDDVPLHVLVWNLTEEDHRDLQPYRPSVVELASFLRERRLHHALAHPLYRMGPPLTPGHVERLLLLFSVWEGRNGARPEETNLLACRLAAAASPGYRAKLSERHGLAPAGDGGIGLSGGSDDHGALDIATTWTRAEGGTVERFLDSVTTGYGVPGGAHGSVVKLAHAIGALAVNAYREGGRPLPEPLAESVAELFDADAEDAARRHEEIREATRRLSRVLGYRAREGGVDLDRLDGLGVRLTSVVAATALQLPYLGTARHQADARSGIDEIEAAFFGESEEAHGLEAMVFTDTFDETNGVAGTMRRLAARSARGELPVRVAAAREDADERPGLTTFSQDWRLELPSYEQLELRFPLITDVLASVERHQPRIVHVATPGPVGVCGLIAARLLRIPIVGSYHTELGPYTLHLTRDLLVAEAMDAWVDWFYRQCRLVLAPTHAVAEALRRRGHADVEVWGRGVDADAFAPRRRNGVLRDHLLSGGDTLLLSVGRISREKRLDVLLAAFARLCEDEPGARLAVVGDGPAREELEAAAPEGVTFLGELHGDGLAQVYASSDLFCFPSTTDTFGQVLLEAGASGLPAVAAAAGGALELVDDGRTGLLVPPGDVAALTAAMRELVEDPLRRAALAERAQTEAQARSWARSDGELLAAYRAAEAFERRSVRAEALAA